MKSRNAFFLGCISLALVSPQAFAAVTLASSEQDRQAKQAVPASGKALIYVYRLNDDNRAAPGLWLNGRASGNLEPRTYGMWAAGPGRLAIRAGQVDANPLSFSCEAGRVYFVQLTVNKDGSVSLRQVSYGVGRKDLQQARLVLDPALAARAALSPKPVPIPVTPPVSIKQAPAVRETPAVRPPPVQKSAPVSDDEEPAASGVTLIVKLGSFTLASDSQILLGSSRSFSAVNPAYGLEGEWRFQNGVAIGVEVFGHNQEYSTAAATGSGEMSVLNVLFNVKKYFRPTAVVQPYAGLGFGTSASNFSPGSSSGTSGITGGAGGFAVQGMAGVAFRWRHVGIYSEFKYVRAETEGTDLVTGSKETVDVSGSGLFAGLNVHF